MKTIEARTALGIGRKVPVSSTRTRRTIPAVITPCIGVHVGPAVVETSAEREREPAIG